MIFNYTNCMGRKRMREGDCRRKSAIDIFNYLTCVLNRRMPASMPCPRHCLPHLSVAHHHLPLPTIVHNHSYNCQKKHPIKEYSGKWKRPPVSYRVHVLQTRRSLGKQTGFATWWSSKGFLQIIGKNLTFIDPSPHEGLSSSWYLL